MSQDTNQSEHQTEQLQRFLSIQSTAQMLFFVADNNAADLDALDVAAEALLAKFDASSDEAEAVQSRLAGLRATRQLSQEELATQVRTAAEQMAELSKDFQVLVKPLIAWMQTADWRASQAYIAKHAEALLTDDGEAALQMLWMGNQENVEAAQNIQQHFLLLRECRELGVDAAYEALFDEIAADGNGENALIEQLGDLLISWMQTADWDASQAYLSEHAEMLLTDAGEAAIRMLLVGNQDDENAVGQIQLHLAILQQCRTHGINAIYQQLHGA
ncbi:MAG: hypothetical protein AAF639_07850 [Chloroflexota bacterium]